MSFVRLIIDTPLTAVGAVSTLNLAPLQLPAMNNFINYLAGAAGGTYMGLFSFAVGSEPAVGTLTVSAGGSTNTQTCTVLNTTFTAVTSGAVAASAQFNISATAATQAASMVLAINAVLPLQVLASNVLGVVSVTSLVPGLIGNGSQMSAGTLSNVALGAFASGSNGTSYVVDLR